MLDIRYVYTNTGSHTRKNGKTSYRYKPHTRVKGDLSSKYFSKSEWQYEILLEVQNVLSLPV